MAEEVVGVHLGGDGCRTAGSVDYLDGGAE
jgi:hypothetical protein